MSTARSHQLRSKRAWINKRDCVLEAGSDAHYQDPVYYSSAYADRHNDVAYYVELCLTEACAKSNGRVLEYGCGNGRISLPLAREGLSVTGIDRSKPMLADLRAKLRNEPSSVGDRITIKRGDMRTARLPLKYGVVLCPFNTLLHLYTRQDIERFFSRVKLHLAPGGRFVFDVSVPNPAELASDPERAYRVPRFRHPSSGEVVRYAERFDYDSLQQVLTVTMEFEPRDRPEGSWITPLAHRQYYPQELEALLHYNGLDIVEVHADFNKTPPTRHSASLVYLCRSTSRRRAKA